jgi:hypothetical protein
MAKLVTKRKHLVSLEELERRHLSEIETISKRGSDKDDIERIEYLCCGVCFAKQGISQSRETDGGLVITFNRRSRSLELWHK